MAGHAFILGGTGQIGQAVAVDLMQRGWSVTLACRGGSAQPVMLLERGARIVTVDREDPASLVKAVGNGADVLIDCVAFDAVHARQLIGLTPVIGAFAVISSASVYCDAHSRTLDEAATQGFPDFPAPIRESQTTVRPGSDTYSTRKVAMEQHLLQDLNRPLLILRPCAIYGQPSAHPREWWFVKRMLDQRETIPLAYQGTSRFHTSSANNIAALIGHWLSDPITRILNIADPQALSVAEIGAAIGDILGYRGEILPIEATPDTMKANIGRTPWSVPAPFVLDMTAAQALGYQPVTDYPAAVRAVCDWLRLQPRDNWQSNFQILASYPYAQFDYAAEDRFFAALKQAH